MIGRGGKIAASSSAAKLSASLACGRITMAGARSSSCSSSRASRRARRADLHDFDRDVVATETMNEAGRPRQAQLLDDVVLHQRRGGGGQGDDRRGTEAWQIAAQHAIVGAEVVAPLGDAMGFVDGHQRRFSLGQHFGEARDAQALRRDEEELQFAGEIIDAGLPGGGAIAAGMDALDRAMHPFSLAA